MNPPPTGDVPVPSGGLRAEVEAQTSRPAPALLDAFVDLLQERFGGSLQAVLLYGSCLHSGDPTDGIVDLYAVVDDYRSAYPSATLRLFNAWIPPNVFYAEVTRDGVTLRAKYAVLSARHFQRGCSGWYHSYVWARFAQPSRLLWARDDGARATVLDAVASAVRTFLREAAAILAGEDVDAEGLWTRGLGLTYASELRPEAASRVQYLTQRNLPDYVRLTQAAAAELPDLRSPLPGGGYRIPGGPPRRRRARRRWWLRRWQGKVLSVLRLGKSVFTFAGGVDYAVWKIQRHTGVELEVTPRVRKHPILMGPWILWRLLRKGALR